MQINGLDRFVKEISPSDDIEPRPFSYYLDKSNIVLLGDPGLGKTHILKLASTHDNVDLINMRIFLANGPKKYQDILYIDAIDERRPRFFDTNQFQIDSCLQLLKTSGASKVRLSCRTADWLGDLDLGFFNDYFKNNGGCVVLKLLPLTNNEIDQIIEESTNKKTNPFIFRKTAESKGIDTLLTNPQTLLMLIEMVTQIEDWPKTKKDLYQKSSKNLLNEKNKQHSANMPGISENILLDAAGSISASILISGIDGINLSNDADGNFPSYCEIPFDDKNAISKTLKSRAFLSIHDEKITYIHRTIAEFLAAQYLSKLIYKNGMPLRSIQNFMGTDTYPVSQFRGLHAWLATFLKEEDAQILIKSDPYGILIYGDAAALSPKNRKFLLNSLKNLTQDDPWFRSQHWAVEPFGALSGDDMIESFKEILTCPPEEYFHLRSIVLDAIENGYPKHQLLDTLINIISNIELPYSERISALESIVKILPNGLSRLKEYWENTTINDALSLRLLVYTICKFYKEETQLENILKVMDLLLNNNLLQSEVIFWEIEKLLPVKLISFLLDFMNIHIKYDDLNPHSAENHRIINFFSQLIIRLIKSDEPIPTNNLWLWLQCLNKICNLVVEIRISDIKSYLLCNKNKLVELFWKAIEGFHQYNNTWSFLYNFNQITMNAMNNDEIVNEALFFLNSSTKISNKEIFLYELSLSLIFKSEPPNTKIFTELYNFAIRSPSLIEIRHNFSYWIIDQVPYDFLKSNQSPSNPQENVKNYWPTLIETHKAEIHNGSATHLLSNIAAFYFSLVDNMSHISPENRLKTIFGEKNLSTVLSGLKAITKRSDIPSPIEVVANSGKLYLWWYAVLAGMDELWLENPNLSAYPEKLLCAALAIDTVYPTNYYNPAARKWKETLILQNPDITQEVFRQIIRAQLERGDSYIFGVNEIFGNATTQFRSLALEFLNDFPHMNLQTLRSFLLIGLKDQSYHEKLNETIDHVIYVKPKLEKKQYHAWLAAGFLINFSKFKKLISKTLSSNIDFIWRLEELGQLKKLSNDQIYFLINSTARLYPNVNRPLGIVVGGHENPWNASEFIIRLICIISTRPELSTGIYFNKLANSTNCNVLTYRDYFKHYGALQLKLRRDNEFQQLTWQETIQILDKKQPVNPSTLHAFTVHHLKNIKNKIRTDNIDKYKRFWNEDAHGNVITPKIETSCQDILIEMLRYEFNSTDVIIDPEGHRVSDGRADIFLSGNSNTKIFIELKRDTHKDLWKAHKVQLEEYVQAPEALGYGIYGIFWFGDNRSGKLPSPPKGTSIPNTPEELEESIRSIIDDDKKYRIEVIVIDVSPPFSPSKQSRMKEIKPITEKIDT